MKKYGVKLNSGKIIWIMADDVRIKPDILLFVELPESGKPRIVAGVPLREVHHFADPDVLTNNSPEA